MSRRALFSVSISLLSCISLVLARSPHAPGRANNVSLIRLIANPKAFEGRRLLLAGYLDHNGLDRAVGLYVTELDGQNFIISNSVEAATISYQYNNLSLVTQRTDARGDSYELISSALPFPLTALSYTRLARTLAESRSTERLDGSRAVRDTAHRPRVHCDGDDGDDVRHLRHPLLSFAFLAWAVASRRLSSGPRRASMVAAP